MSLRSSRSEFVRKLLLAIAPVALLMTTASSAVASTKQESILQDDAIFGNPDLRDEGLARAKDLGVTTIHAVINWNTVAPAITSRTKPSGFNGASPAAYQSESWDRLDDFVKAATQTGIHIIFTPTGPVPRWASKCKDSEIDKAAPLVCKPDPKEYQAFVTAVMKRYTGTYRDENQGQEVLPKVDRWSIWNEPNVGGWIQPVSQSPKIYRDLLYAGITGAKKGNKRAKVYMGETAPLNSSLLFLQRVLCIDDKGNPLKGKAATKVGCTSGKRLKRFDVAGYTHHPYDRGASPPFKATKGKYGLTLFEISKLYATLDAAAKLGVVKRNLPVYNTEFGVSTKPEDRKFGVSYADQAAAINRAEWISYNDKRLQSFAQYQLNNDGAIGGLGGMATFQTGLRFRDETGALQNKPSYFAFKTPLYVTGKPGNVRVWGGVRGQSGVPVEIQAGKGTSFATVKTVKTNRFGYIDVKKVNIPKGKNVRLMWSAGYVTIASRVAKIEKQ